MKFSWLKKEARIPKDKTKQYYKETKDQIINSQLNQHFVFNSLNAIQHFISLNEKKLSLQYLAMFSKLIRYLLTYIEKPFVPFSEEINMLDIYMKLQKLRYQDQLKYTLFLSENDIERDNIIPKNLMGTLLEILIEKSPLLHLPKSKMHISLSVLNNSLQFQTKIENIQQLYITNMFTESLKDWEENVNLMNQKSGTSNSNKIYFNKEFNNNHCLNVILSIPFAKI